jgi:hypothetical protein
VITDNFRRASTRDAVDEAQAEVFAWWTPKRVPLTAIVLSFRADKSMLAAIISVVGARLLGSQSGKAKIGKPHNSLKSIDWPWQEEVIIRPLLTLLKTKTGAVVAKSHGHQRHVTCLRMLAIISHRPRAL